MGYIKLYLLFQNVFYSRKNYKKPELQISPHQAFEEEVALLDTFFSGKNTFYVYAFRFCNIV